MIRRAILPSACVTISHTLGLHESASFCEDREDGFKVSQRLRSPLVNRDILRERFKPKNVSGNADEIKVYNLFNRDAKHQFEGEGGLPIARVATLEIKGDLQAVVDLIEDFNSRKQWDKTCADSQKTLTKDMTRVNYFQGKPGLIVPARTFVWQQSRLEGAVVGKDYSAVVIFCKDASGALPNLSLNRVRGKMNSLLILEPQGLTKTRVTYLVEMDSGGVIAKWLLGDKVSDFFAGESPIEWLKSLKKAVESKLLDENIGVEEAARITFLKSLAKKDALGTSIVDDVGLATTTTKEDLQETIRVLETRLKELRKSERAEKLDLSELRRRVATDLEKARHQLRAARWSS